MYFLLLGSETRVPGSWEFLPAPSLEGWQALRLGQAGEGFMGRDEVRPDFSQCPVGKGERGEAVEQRGGEVGAVFRTCLEEGCAGGLGRGRQRPGDSAESDLGGEPHQGSQDRTGPSKQHGEGKDHGFLD